MSETTTLEVSPLLELASRVEAAEMGDWDLDRLINVALHERGTVKVRQHTRSLDTALELVPEGWEWRVQGGRDGTYHAWVESGGDFGAIDSRHTETFAATPALALTAACLRARAALEGGEA